MGHFVVAGEGRIDGGTATHHVAQDPVDDQVANDDAECRAQEGIATSALAAGDDPATPLPDRRRLLQHHLPGEQDQLPRDVEAVGQERPVAGIGALLGIHPADGEDHLVGLARQ